MSLLGSWTGHRERIAEIEGWRDGTATLVVTGQKGQTFTGHLAFSTPGGAERRPSGVPSPRTAS